MMEAQIKEESKNASICFETSGDNLASLTLVEKYDRFINENYDAGAESDGDFFPNDTMLKEEYAQLRNDTANFMRAARNDNRLSTDLRTKYKNNDNENDANLSVVDEEPRNGTVIGETSSKLSPNRDSSKDERSGLVCLNELIEKLNLVRKCEPQGNSIFCTEAELVSLQERYSAILDFMHDKLSTFERSNSSKDLTNQQQEVEEEVEVKESENEKNDMSKQQSEDAKLLADKMESVYKARDRYYEVEQQVREHVEQLELVERYKMESVG